MKLAILLTFDRLPLSGLGCYGSPGGATAAFDRFACESVVFDQHFVESTDPVAVKHAWDGGRIQLPPTEEQPVQPAAMEETLRAAGVNIRSFDENEGGFQWLVDQARELLAGPEPASQDKLLLRLRARGVSETTETSFDDEISAIDAEFGRLRTSVETVTDSGDCELLMIVIAALGQTPDCDGGPFHRLIEAVVHTPLIVSSTDGESGTRRRAFVRPCDVPPTLGHWFEVPLESGGCDSRSLLPLVRGETEEFTDPDRRFACTGDGRGAFGIRSSAFHLIAASADALSGPVIDHADQLRLFHKPEDVWDVHDVAVQNPEAADELRNELRQFLKRRGDSGASRRLSR